MEYRINDILILVLPFYIHVIQEQNTIKVCTFSHTKQLHDIFWLSLDEV